MQLRPYQEDSIAAVLAAMESSQNVILQAPTGAGKTIILCEIVKRLLSLCPDGRILVMAHRRELVQQTADKMARVWPDHPPIGIACAGADKRVIHHGSIVIASIQTLARRIGDVMPFNLAIIDEVHRVPDLTQRDSQYVTVIEALRGYFPEMRLLGVTATPYRLGHGYIYGDKCKEGAINLFSDLHHQIKVKDLVAEKFLSEMRGKIRVDAEFTEQLKGIKVNGDYVEGELGKLMSKPKYVHAVVGAIKEWAPDRKHIMIFACTIDHAERIKDVCEFDGFNTGIVHSRTPKGERDATLADFVAGRLHVIVNVNVLIEGFDAPLTDCIVMARPTMSPALYLQQAGRGLRTAEGKGDCLLIDLAGNAVSFGVDFDAVKVKIPKAAKEEGEAPVKVCPNCQELCHAAVKSCPSCGHEFPMEEAEEKTAPPVLRDVKLNSVGVLDGEITGVDLECYVARSSGAEMVRVKVKTTAVLYPVCHYFNFNDGAHDFVRRKSRSWWRNAQGLDNPPPESNEEAEFIFNADRLIGRKVRIQEEGKFLKIMGW